MRFVWTMFLCSTLIIMKLKNVKIVVILFCLSNFVKYSYSNKHLSEKKNMIYYE